MEELLKAQISVIKEIHENQTARLIELYDIKKSHLENEKMNALANLKASQKEELGPIMVTIDFLQNQRNKIKE